MDLIACTEAQDESVESTGGTSAGSDVAVTPLYSKLLSLKAQFVVSSASACIVRWILAKSPDNDITGATFMSNFHSSDDTTAAREVRKYILAKGITYVSADRLRSPVRIFVKRKAWARASPMREDDRIKLILAKNAPGSTAEISGFGTMYVRANG